MVKCIAGRNELFGWEIYIDGTWSFFVSVSFCFILEYDLFSVCEYVYGRVLEKFNNHCASVFK